MNRSKRRGALLVELLVATLMALCVGAGLVVLMKSTYQTQTDVQGENLSAAGVRQVLDTLADRLRNAQQLSTAPYAVMSSANASDITIYTDAAGDTARYFLDTTASPTALKLTTTTAGIGSTSTVLSGLQALTFTYYQDPAGHYTDPASSWVTTANPNQPTAAEIPLVAAIRINATVSLNGFNQTVVTWVRLRNSPHF